jgi:phage shock protein PspC (stress-responsive transcriptional regulator)
MYTPTQRLMRSRNDRVLSGVAGGIAHYLDVDPLVIRVTFILLALFVSGSGLLLYLILLFLMPKAPKTVASVSGSREAFVAGRSRRDQGQYAAMTGMPDDPQEPDDGEEIPIENVRSGTDAAADDEARMRRNWLLGIGLLGLGLFFLLQMVLPWWITPFLIPAFLIAAGVFLLRLSRDKQQRNNNGTNGSNGNGTGDDETLI